MSVVRTRATRAGIAMAVTGALVSASMATTTVASAAPKGTVLHIAITKHRMYVDGPTTFPAGRLKLYVESGSGTGRGVEVIRLHKGYTFKEYKHDLKVAFTGNDQEKSLKRLNRAIDNTEMFGGLFAPENHVRHGTVLLRHPGGRYVLYDDTTGLPRRPVRLTVTAPEGPQTLPDADAKVVGKTNTRFGGDEVLPANGNIRFKNRSTESPHFLILLQVTEDTSRQDVLDSFESDEPPDFFLEGEQDIDVVGSGHAMNVHLNLPVGKYAELCFFLDPEEGVPHAFMGMVKMVHAE